MEYILAIDCGTQGVKVGLFDIEGKIVSQSFKRLKLTRGPRCGVFTQEAQDWMRAIFEAIFECFSRGGNDKKKDVIAIGVTATSATVLFCDADGRPFMPAIMWQDSRAKDEAREITEIGDGALSCVNGIEEAEFFWPKVFWTQRHLPEIFGRTSWITDAVDWIIFQLTGRKNFSYSNAIIKAHYDGRWPDLVTRDILCRLSRKIVYPNEFAGTLTPEIAMRLGMPMGTPVVSAGIDGIASIIGAVPATDEILISMGTSWTQYGFSDKANSASNAWGPFRPFKGIVDFDRYVYEAGQIIPGEMISQFVSHFKLSANDLKDIEIEAGKARKIPELNIKWSNRKPVGIKLRRKFAALYPQYSILEIFRAILEEVVKGCQMNVMNLITLTPSTSERRLLLCGGAVKSALWRQILEDRIGLPIRVCIEQDAALKGAAVCAGLAHGIRF